MLFISASEEWRAKHPGAVIGLLELSCVENTHPSPELEEIQGEIVNRLRERYKGFDRQDFLALPVMTAYEQYYKQFKKTYHVQLQVESIVLKGKDLPQVSPLVDANFAAEVESFVLTAGHDADLLQEPIVFDVSREGDQISQLNGESRAMRAGDMVMRDASGVSCSILYGQDQRSPISAGTNHVLYVAYAPPGVPVESVQAQLCQIETCVRLFSPAAVVERRELLHA